MIYNNIVVSIKRKLLLMNKTVTYGVASKKIRSRRLLWEDNFRKRNAKKKSLEKPTVEEIIFEMRYKKRNRQENYQNNNNSLFQSKLFDILQTSHLKDKKNSTVKNSSQPLFPNNKDNKNIQLQFTISRKNSTTKVPIKRLKSNALSNTYSKDIIGIPSLKEDLNITCQISQIQIKERPQSCHINRNKNKKMLEIPIFQTLQKKKKVKIAKIGFLSFKKENNNFMNLSPWDAEEISYLA